MIDVKDLRIGSLVSQNGSYGYVYSIESPEPKNNKRFSDKVVITLFDNGLEVVPINEIKPILLTEEFLSKFGAIPHYNLNYDYFTFELVTDFRMTNYLLKKQKDGSFEFTSKEGSFERNIKHVHQLQNLFYALTGQELTLTK